MRISTLAWLLVPLLSAASASDTITCDSDNHCPEDYPCCSNEGVCGTGTYCLGPCEPRWSFNSSACMPAPICKSGTYKPRTDNMMNDTSYLGNTTDTDFIYYGEIEDSSDDYLMLKMPKNSVGGVISSSFYVWFGKVSMKFKTSHNAGVVSAAILFSQVQDEIDFEFVGSELEIAESNFYFEGLLNYTNSADLSTSNTYENWHTYEIDWTEESITWSIDGTAMRTLNRNDTFNSTNNEYQYPQTPSRIQLSIWPAGDSSSAAGTIEWAGGDIDWDASDFSDPGYLYVGVDTVEVECYDVPSFAQTDGKVQRSYIYDGKGYLQENIIVSDKQTWMKDLGRTGFDTGEDSEDSSSSSSKKSTSTSSEKSSSSSSSSSEKSSSSSSSSSSSASKKSTTTTSSSSSSSSKKSSTTTPSSSSSHSSETKKSSSHPTAFTSSSSRTSSSTSVSSTVLSPTSTSSESTESTSSELATTSSESSSVSSQIDLVQSSTASSSTTATIASKNVANIDSPNTVTLLSVCIALVSQLFI